MAIQRSTRNNITFLSPLTMEKLLSTPVKKYNARKAIKKARKNLRRQGLKV